MDTKLTLVLFGKMHFATEAKAISNIDGRCCVMGINSLRTIAAYMYYENNNITICKQIAVTLPLFNL